MAAAGFTHGGFYKQFGFKAELMAESATCSVAKTTALTASLEMTQFVQLYLSGDAVRQPEAVRAMFADGIESLLALLSTQGAKLDATDPNQVRAKAINLLAHALGEVVLSRACPDDSPLADEILSACRTQILASLHSS